MGERDNSNLEKLRKNKIEGVGKDAPIITNEHGAKQSDSTYDFIELDPKAIFEITKVLKKGREKYGSDNWRNITIEDHLNHMLIHTFAYLAGDKQDDHLSHAVCRGIFALAVDIQENIQN